MFDACEYAVREANTDGCDVVRDSDLSRCGEVCVIVKAEPVVLVAPAAIRTTIPAQDDSVVCACVDGDGVRVPKHRDATHPLRKADIIADFIAIPILTALVPSGAEEVPVKAQCECACV